MESPVLFLDVDGVLNRCGASSQGLESDKILLLSEIVRAAKCDLIVSSTWRKYKRLRRRLTQAIHDYGMKIEGWTPVLEDDSVLNRPSRGKEIQAWLDVHPMISRFVIVDDDRDMGDLLEHLVPTDSHEGLTSEVAAEIIERFLENEPEPY